MNLATMSKDEKSLLLFLETRAVDHAGKIQTVHMNEDDFKIAERWNKKAFIKFGRIAFEDTDKSGTHWCSLSEEAWTLAAAERKARATRTWLKRTWKTAAEKHST